MKKYIILLVFAAFVFCLTGCAKKAAKPYHSSQDNPAGVTKPEIKATPTTFGEVAANKHKPGTDITFAAIILPNEIIQTSSTSDAKRYYMLVVDKNSEYIKQADKLLTEFRNLYGQVKSNKKISMDQDTFISIINQYNDLIDKVNALAVNPKEAVAIELEGFDESGIPMQDNWETIIHESSTPGMPGYTNPGFTPLTVPDFKTPDLSHDFSYETLESANETLASLESSDPPDMDKKLPKISSINVNNYDSSEVNKYNQLVKRYNAELARRRKFVSMRLPGEIELMIFKLQNVVSANSYKITASVNTEPDLARKTYTKIFNDTPRAYIREISSDGNNVVKHFFGKTNYYITSYPAGAHITVDGKDMGTTPAMIKDITSGNKITVVLKSPGYSDLEKTIDTTANLTGVTDLELKMTKQ